MVDPVRSKIMSSIKGKDTKPELMLRRALYAKGIRYRLHSKSLPGHPDLVLSKYNAVILINGCFWHKHNCHIFNPNRKLSKTWAAKIDANVERDKRNINEYLNSGWRVLVVWECALQGKTKQPLSAIVNIVINWLNNNTSNFIEISGIDNN